VNPEYQAWLEKQEPESRPNDLFWKWGSMPTDPKHIDEVWEDELGYTAANVGDECKARDQYKKEKYGTPAPKTQATAPAKASET
jgi:hypothetical protein